MLTGVWSGAASAADAQASCLALAGKHYAPAVIGLPTTGADITSTQLVAATATLGEYCRVEGAIHPVDPTAPDIRFRVNLPTTWNGKALGMGGGGYNGNIPNTTAAPTLGNFPGVVLPLKQGYITYAGDSGHQSADADDASFAMNDEALLNYGNQHVKKTRDIMVAIAKDRYGTAPRRIYFSGGSTGGREGLTAASRWPNDFDGVLTNYPTANFMGLRLWGAALAQAIYPNDSEGWIPPAVVNQIATLATQRCDALDGVADNLVSNMAACRALSDELVADLSCKNGEVGNITNGFPNCLTPPMIAKTLQVYHEGYTLPYSFAFGVNNYPGYNALEGITMQIGSQPQPLNPLTSGPNAHHSDRADQFTRYFITRDPNFNLFSLDIFNPGPWQQRIIDLSGIIGVLNPDLSAFRAKGGKILWLQGQDDPSVTPYANAQVYERMVAHMGQNAVDSFLRFFLVPGLAHGGGKFSPTWDNLTALDNWVEKGVPPVKPITFDGTNTATRGRSRPLCVYPTWPKYNGTGDINVAANYTCVAGETGTRLQCDVDGNGRVDRNDIAAIFAARGTIAAFGGDPRDGNGDGHITVMDSRVCTLRCNNALCAQ